MSSRRNAGGTIAEVMVSFALLMLLGVMTAQTVLGSWRLLERSAGRLQEIARLQRAYYLQEDLEKTQVWRGKPAYFQREEEDGSREAGFEGGEIVLYRYELEEGGAVIYGVEEMDRR